MSSLADLACVPSDEQTPRVNENQAKELLSALHEDWQFNPHGHLERLLVFKNFIEAMNFANCIGEIAEQEGHHPDIHVGWGRCGIEIWTHAIGGLSKSDFYLAAKVDRAHNHKSRIANDEKGD